MPSRFVDHSGKVFGAWRVESFHSRDKHGHPIWLCVCECGTRRPVIMGSLQKGRSSSCGCLATDARADKTRKHGWAGTPTYKSWHSMRQRCDGKGGHESYPDRGISVCERWLSFENFLADMGERPVGTTLDRINNLQGYEPSNCRWATPEQQANNRSTNVTEEVNGEVLTVAQAARKYGMHISGVRHRLRRGWSLQAAVSIPALRNQYEQR